MKLGILSKVFARPTLELVLDAVAATGLECVQFNPESAGLAPMPETFPLELADRICAAAEVRGISIASVQATFNMSHPDETFRRDGLRRLRGSIAACARLGTSNVAICIGTRDRQDMWRYHPKNDSPAAWRDMISCLSEAVEMAEHVGVTLAFEPEVTNVVDSALKARRLLDEIRSPHLKITMDAANLFHAGELPRMAEILEQAFELIGNDVVLAHAKDLSHDGEAGHEAAGQGRLDYGRYLSLLHAYRFEGPLLLHALAEAQVPGCVAFLREKVANA